MKGAYGRFFFGIAMLTVALAGAGCEQQSTSEAGGNSARSNAPARSAGDASTSAMKMIVTSSGLPGQGSAIPIQYTCDGQDFSPPLQWQGAPAQAKSIAILCEDPDAPGGLWTHWVLYDLPANTNSLPEKLDQSETLPSGARQGKNDFGKVGYNGPCPPLGKPHRYYFKVFALDEFTKLPAGASRAELLKMMEGHILAQGDVMGTYQRKR